MTGRAGPGRMERCHLQAVFIVSTFVGDIKDHPALKQAYETGKNI